MAEDVAAAAPSARREVALRAVTTALLVVLYWALRRVPAPFLAPEAGWDGRASVHPPPFPFVSVVHVGLAPVLVAFVLVELFAALMPALRAGRHGSAADRAGLTRAAWFLAMLLAAYASARAVGALAMAVSPWDAPVLPGGPLVYAGLALTLTAGTALVSWIALAIGRYGLGNGFAVLMSAHVLVEVPDALPRLAEQFEHGGVFLPLALEAAALGIFLRVMRGDPRHTVRVPVPTCGVLPWVAAATVLCPSLLTPAPPWDGAFRVGSGFADDRLAVSVIVPLALAIVFARLFTARPRVTACWSAAMLKDSAAPDVAGATLRAHLLSILLIGLGVALPFLARSFGNYVAVTLSLLQPALVGAAAMDVIAEARARRRLGPLVPAFPLHRVYAVEPALAALAQAGIPAAARARYFRALFHFFAPFAPIELLVPAARAEEAAAICARIARPEPAVPPAAEAAPS